MPMRSVRSGCAGPDPAIRRSHGSVGISRSKPSTARSRDKVDTFRLDAIVAAAAEVLRESPYAERYDLADVLDVADEWAEELPGTDQVHEFLGFLDTLVEIDR